MRWRQKTARSAGKGVTLAGAAGWYEEWNEVLLRFLERLGIDFVKHFELGDLDFDELLSVALR